MLAEAELALIAHLQGDVLAQHVREIGCLPEHSDEDLVRTLALNAPALYVQAGRVIPGHENGGYTLQMGITVITRNVRGATAARHGDLETVGLHQLIDAILWRLNEPALDASGRAVEQWRFESCEPLEDDVLTAAGLHVALIGVTAYGRLSRMDWGNRPPLPDLELIHTESRLTPSGTPLVDDIHLPTE